MPGQPIKKQASEVDPRSENIRASGQLRIEKARAANRPLWTLMLIAGPGLLVMVGENDGPSMLSYAATGASYGIGFFVPFIVLTFVLAFVVQEMTARLGIATGRGHAELIFDRFGDFWGFFALGDLVFGNVLTLVTEFIAVQAGALYFGVPAWLSVLCAVLLVFATLTTRRYVTWERLLMGLALGNLLFIPAALLAHPNGAALMHALATWGPLPGGINQTFFMLVLANIGATITPWMLFFQQGAVVDKGMVKGDLAHCRLETGLGALVAAAVAIATVVACAPLFASHVSVARLEGVGDFATALRPHIGNVGATLFALGMIEAGVVAAMTISTSSAYAVGEALRARHSLNAGIFESGPFYMVALGSVIVAAGIVLIPHAPLLAITLTVNVIATLLMAPALLFVLLLVNDRELVGSLANNSRANVAGGAIVVLISLLGAIYGFLTLFPHTIGIDR